MPGPLKKILRSFIRILSWSVVYYLVTWFSLSFFLTDNGIAIAWPPVGIFISAILLSKPSERPFLVICLLAADILADLHTGLPNYMIIIYGLLSTGDAVISSWLLLRYVANPFNFSKARNLLLYLLFSVLLCNGFFSGIVAAFTSGIQGSSFFEGYLFSWVADSVGNVMMVPLIISWASFSVKDLRSFELKRFIELFLLVVSLILLNLILLPYIKNDILFSFIINYLTFPFIIWAIFRFDMKILTFVFLLMTSVLLFNLMQNNRVFSDFSSGRNFVFFQLYIASIAIVSLLITSIKDERNNAFLALMESEKKYKTVADYTYTWEYWMDQYGVIRYMSPSVERVTGYKAEVFKKNPGLLDEMVFTDDRKLWEDHKKEIAEKCAGEMHCEVEFRIVTKDKKIKWICHDCRQIGQNDESLGIRVSNRDITSLVDAERKLLMNTAEIEERERNRYSRELHDGLGPLLSTIKMYIQSLSEATNPERIRLIADKSNQNIKLAIRTMREIAHGLSPSNLSNSGYVGAVSDFIDDINKLQELRVNFTFNCRDRFNDFYELILYRITTELITNTLKHAQATDAEINFDHEADSGNIRLIYKDNGKGFDTGKKGEGMGLKNIEQRINMLGGNLIVRSNPGNGTQVYIDFHVNMHSERIKVDHNLN